MEKQEIIQEAEKYMRENIPKSREDKDSYLKHILGARDHAINLSKIYGADKFVVEISALLHDIGADVGKDHPIKSAEIAKEFLSKFEISKEIVESILICISKHSMGSTTETIEEQIIQDADGIIFIEDTYKYFFNQGKKRASSLEEARTWAKEKAKGMLNKIKTKEGIKIANKSLSKTIKDLEEMQ